ncbi:RHS repeat-associated core domain protein-containing protein [Pseudomonas sp. GM78]|uniref:RHS repeat-associated core domain-containing protein n=1 Tax=Pseudomonas sp. GM78 TaxID=1144337 RepID=UPI000270D0B8|nr:RHS repeat-associated core domain-containing protein [Pseudomonas sp. GM78]EJN26288.1 RHS repeat-associated core domain protein-containing protein [Pseudomonas sp. GM78]
MPTHSRNTILLATDQQRSVLSALNAHGPHPIAYTAYGHRPAENGLLSLLGFNGELPDPLTGHYHLGNGYRQFNPVLMRFNSPDSWSPFGKGGLNAYCYCLGDPRNRIDPEGHASGPIGRFFSRMLGFPVPSRKDAVIAAIKNNKKNFAAHSIFAPIVSLPSANAKQFTKFERTKYLAKKIDNKVHFIEAYKNDYVEFTSSRHVTLGKKGKFYAEPPQLIQIQANSNADTLTKKYVNSLNTYMKEKNRSMLASSIFETLAPSHGKLTAKDVNLYNAASMLSDIRLT